MSQGDKQTVVWIAWMRNLAVGNMLQWEKGVSLRVLPEVVLQPFLRFCVLDLELLV